MLLKWAGNKTDLLQEINTCLPKKISRYHEPFLGTGAVALSLQHKPESFHLNDINPNLIALFRVILEGEERIRLLMEYINILVATLGPEALQAKPRYNLLRGYFNANKQSLTDIERAAFLIMFNRVGFNGLYRENKKSNFNVPFAELHFKKLDLPRLEDYLHVYRHLSTTKTSLTNYDWLKAPLSPTPLDVFYVDSPYDVPEGKVGFNYSGTQFLKEQQEQLAEKIHCIHDSGARFVASNASTPLIASLYRKFTIVEVKVYRKISGKKSGRKSETEYLIFN